jgi:HK97 gp10 family phage protein
MPKGVVRIEGFKECREALQELSKGVRRGVGKRALLAPAAVIAAVVKARAPISNDPHDRSPGSLKDSVKAVTDKSVKGGPRAAVLAADPAAVPNEFGTHKMAARPFFRPAVDAARAAAAVAFAAALKSEVDAAVKRAAAKAAK